MQNVCIANEPLFYLLIDDAIPIELCINLIQSYRKRETVLTMATDGTPLNDILRKRNVSVIFFNTR